MPCASELLKERFRKQAEERRAAGRGRSHPQAAKARTAHQQVLAPLRWRAARRRRRFKAPAARASPSRRDPHPPKEPPPASSSRASRRRRACAAPPGRARQSPSPPESPAGADCSPFEVGTDSTSNVASGIARLAEQVVLAGEMLEGVRAEPPSAINRECSRLRQLTMARSSLRKPPSSKGGSPPDPPRPSAPRPIGDQEPLRNSRSARPPRSPRPRATARGSRRTTARGLKIAVRPQTDPAGQCHWRAAVEVLQRVFQPQHTGIRPAWRSARSRQRSEKSCPSSTISTSKRKVSIRLERGGSSTRRSKASARLKLAPCPRPAAGDRTASERSAPTACRRHAIEPICQRPVVAQV